MDCGVIVCPGITIDNTAVIGAGTIVTKSIPANTIAAGVLAHSIRTTTANDEKFWQTERTNYLKGKFK
ncbi:hypothetical protein FC19_GL001647 [Liquorilactobacillus aquaticus DSM 21051]|uniref:Acetyltransferase n=1 Tax=Liquorilactobacillus aquaticus DSM 21051 TaxID=1423725 RepID=A0A0R2D0S7_9LACO|nr:hypothetical protein [Liquorilactobacillus aquaticus]KRM97601.1 hypothetical protein FC19_GL001647 [Liquorilactobacillus aquaticus DSM 21051]